MSTHDKDPRWREDVAVLHQAAAKVRADARRAQATFGTDPDVALYLAVVFDEAEWSVGRGDLKPATVRRAVVELATRINTGTGE